MEKSQHTSRQPKEKVAFGHHYHVQKDKQDKDAAKVNQQTVQKSPHRISRLPRVVRTGSVVRSHDSVAVKAKTTGQDVGSAVPDQEKVKPSSIPKRKRLASRDNLNNIAESSKRPNLEVKKKIDSSQNFKRSNPGKNHKEALNINTNVKEVRIVNLAPDMSSSCQGHSSSKAKPIPTLGNIFKHDAENNRINEWFADSLDDYMNPLRVTSDETMMPSDHTNVQSPLDDDSRSHHEDVSASIMISQPIGANPDHQGGSERVVDWVTQSEGNVDSESGYRSVSPSGRTVGRSNSPRPLAGVLEQLNTDSSPLLLEENDSDAKFKVVGTGSNNVTISDQCTSTYWMKGVSKCYQFPLDTEPLRNDRDTSPNDVSYVDCFSEILQKTTNFEVEGVVTSNTDSIAGTDLEVRDDASVYALDVFDDYIDDHVVWNHNDSALTYVKSRHECLGCCSKGRRRQRDTKYCHMNKGFRRRHKTYRGIPNHSRVFKSNFGLICRWTARRITNWPKTTGKVKRLRTIFYLQRSLLWQNADAQTNRVTFRDMDTEPEARVCMSANVATVAISQKLVSWLTIYNKLKYDQITKKEIDSTSFNEQNEIKICNEETKYVLQETGLLQCNVKTYNAETKTLALKNNFTTNNEFAFPEDLSLRVYTDAISNDVPSNTNETFNISLKVPGIDDSNYDNEAMKPIYSENNIIHTKLNKTWSSVPKFNSTFCMKTTPSCIKTKCLGLRPVSMHVISTKMRDAHFPNKSFRDESGTDAENKAPRVFLFPNASARTECEDINDQKDTNVDATVSENSNLENSLSVENGCKQSVVTSLPQKKTTMDNAVGTNPTELNALVLTGIKLISISSDEVAVPLHPYGKRENEMLFKETSTSTTRVPGHDIVTSKPRVIDVPDELINIHGLRCPQFGPTKDTLAAEYENFPCAIVAEAHKVLASRSVTCDGNELPPYQIDAMNSAIVVNSHSATDIGRHISKSSEETETLQHTTNYSSTSTTTNTCKTFYPDEAYEQEGTSKENYSMSATTNSNDVANRNVRCLLEDNMNFKVSSWTNTNLPLLASSASIQRNSSEIIAANPKSNDKVECGIQYKNHLNVNENSARRSRTNGADASWVSTAVAPVLPTVTPRARRDTGIQFSKTDSYFLSKELMITSLSPHSSGISAANEKDTVNYSIVPRDNSSRDTNSRYQKNFTSAALSAIAFNNIDCNKSAAVSTNATQYSISDHGKCSKLSKRELSPIHIQIPMTTNKVDVPVQCVNRVRQLKMTTQSPISFKHTKSYQVDANVQYNYIDSRPNMYLHESLSPILMETLNDNCHRNIDTQWVNQDITSNIKRSVFRQSSETILDNVLDTCLPHISPESKGEALQQYSSVGANNQFNFSRGEFDEDASRWLHSTDFINEKDNNQVQYKDACVSGSETHPGESQLMSVFNLSARTSDVRTQTSLYKDDCEDASHVLPTYNPTPFQYSSLKNSFGGLAFSTAAASEGPSMTRGPDHFDRSPECQSLVEPNYLKLCLECPRCSYARRTTKLPKTKSSCTNMKKGFRQYKRNRLELNDDPITIDHQLVTMAGLYGHRNSDTTISQQVGASNMNISSKMDASKWIAGEPDKDFQSMMDLEPAASDLLNYVTQTSPTTAASPIANPTRTAGTVDVFDSKLKRSVSAVASLSNDSLADILPTKECTFDSQKTSPKLSEAAGSGACSEFIRLAKEVKELELQVNPEFCDAETDSNLVIQKSATVFTSRCVLPPLSCNQGRGNGCSNCFFVYDRPRCMVHTDQADFGVQMVPRLQHVGTFHTELEARRGPASSTVDQAVGSVSGTLSTQSTTHSPSTFGEILPPRVYKALYETTKLVSKREAKGYNLKTGSTNVTVPQQGAEEVGSPRKVSGVLTQQCCTCLEGLHRLCRHRVKCAQADAHISAHALQQSVAMLTTRPECRDTQCFIQCDTKPLTDGVSKTTSPVSHFRVENGTQRSSCRVVNTADGKPESIESGYPATVDDCVRTHLIGSCRYYSSLLASKIIRVKEGSAPKEGAEYQEACTMKPSGREDLACQTHNPGRPNVPRTRSCCFLSPSTSLTDIGRGESKDLNAVYCMLTAIEGRIRRLKRNVS